MSISWRRVTNLAAPLYQLRRRRNAKWSKIMQTVLSQARRRYLGLAIVVTGLVVGIGACSSGAPARRSCHFQRRCSRCRHAEKVNTKIARPTARASSGPAVNTS